MLESLTLKQVVDYNPICSICGKNLLINYRFYISYQEEVLEKYPGLGDHFSALRLKDDTLADLKYWEFGLDSSIRKNLKLFNKTLSAFSKPSIIKRCRTCQHANAFELEYFHNQYYETFPKLNFAREFLIFNLTQSIEVLIKREYSSSSPAAMQLLSGGRELYKAEVPGFEFTKANFKILKRKAKMLVTFM
jgi:hypothetical protein